MMLSELKLSLRCLMVAIDPLMRTDRGPALRSVPNRCLSVVFEVENKRCVMEQKMMRSGFFFSRGVCVCIRKTRRITQRPLLLFVML